MSKYRWKNLHNILIKLGYDDSYLRSSATTQTTGSKAAWWDNKTKKWQIPKALNCLSSINFFLGYMLKRGGKGYDPNVYNSNLIKYNCLNK